MIDLIFFIVIIIISLFGVYYFYKQGILQLIGFLRVFKSKNWEITKGKVINAEYKFLQYKEQITRYKYRTRIDFVLKKTYAYSLNGITYQSNQGTAADSLFWRQFKPISSLPKKRVIIFYEENPKTKQLEKGASNLSFYIHNKNTLSEKAKTIIGEDVQVYFNPKNPKKACLSIKTDTIIVLSSFVMLVFGTISAYIAYFIFNDYLLNAIDVITNNI